MGLVVVDPDEKVSDTLCQQLAHLNLDSLPAVNPKIAQEICDHALPELMVCARMDWAQDLARAVATARPTAGAELREAAAVSRALWVA